MDWIKGVQEILPWITALPTIPKTIISGIIVGISAFLLTLIWTPPPESAVKTILSDCYRRSLFTRAHAQLDWDAMYTSIDQCRASIQSNIPKIHRKDLQDDAVELLAIVEQLGRRKLFQGHDNIQIVNKLKLAALRSFRRLAAAANERYPLPESGKLGEAAYFTQQEADAPLSFEDLQNQIKINPTTGEANF